MEEEEEKERDLCIHFWSESVVLSNAASGHCGPKTSVVHAAAESK